MSSATHTIENHIGHPLPQTATKTFTQHESENAKSEDAEAITRAHEPQVERIVEYCADPEQAITNYRLVGVVGLMVVVVLVESVFCFMLYLRRPDRIVVDRTQGGDRVVMINNREYGLTEGVDFRPDAPTEGDKKYIATRYLELLYGNNPDRRDRQLEQAIRLMTPQNGRRFFNYLRDNRILEQQATESWQAVWTPQSVTIDANDSFTIRAIGVQRLTRLVNGASVEETRQLNVIVKLSRDQLGRDDRNLRTGYLVDWFDWNELQRDSQSQTSTVPAGNRMTNSAPLNSQTGRQANTRAGE